MSKRKTNLIYSFLFIVLAAGIAIILYPHVMQRFYRQQAGRAIHDFQQTVSQAREPDLKKLQKKMMEYNEELFRTNQNKLVDAEAYEAIDFDLGEYGFEDGMVAYLSIPAMNVDLPVLLGATETNMDKGAVRLSQTSMPVGGGNTNTVIAAHRGAATAAMFRDIETLAVGDRVYITNYFEKLEYRVVETRVISPNDLNAVLIQPDRDLLTLITCHPYRSNSQRYLVYAERVLNGP